MVLAFSLLYFLPRSSGLPYNSLSFALFSFSINNIDQESKTNQLTTITIWMEITYQHHSPHIDITSRFKKYISQDEEIQYISLLKGLFFK